MATQRLHKLVLVCLVLSAIGLGACTRPASTPPPSGGEGTGEPANWQQATMEAVRYMLLTQTAQAGGEGPPAEGETPEPAPTDAGQATQPAASTPLVVASTPTPTVFTRPSSYTLQPGEYPYCIARRFNVDPGELLAANGIAGGAIVYPGTTLRIPQTGNPFPPPRALRSHPTTYTVQSGDTIYSVGCSFGDVDPLAIASANNLSSPYTLTPGTTINIP